MATLLFIGYLIALSWLLSRLSFFRSSGLSRLQLILLYVLKVAVGIFYGWLGIYYGSTANMTDTWFFHTGGLQEEQLLLNNPARFFSELFEDPYEDGRLKLLSTENSYWNDIKSNALLKGLGLLNLITGGYYLVNVLFYNFFGMIGVICYFKVLTDRFSVSRTAAGISAILLPSVIFWTSGIHKEGILLTATGCITYIVYTAGKDGKWTLKRLLLLALALTLLLIFRNHLLFALLPALLLWLILQRYPRHPLRTTLILYSALTILFFISPYLSDKTDLPGAVARKQLEFLALKGKSSLAVDTLKPTPLGFLANLPQSVDMALTRPHFSNVRHLLSMAAFLEVMLWLLILFLWLRFRAKESHWPQKPVDYFLIAFSISTILIIGLSINNLGAIARYRSVVLTPLLAPLIAGIDWRKLISMIRN